MEDRECLYSGNAWFKEQLDGPDGKFWRRARKMFLFDRSVSSALNLFKFDYRAISSKIRPEGIELVISKNHILTAKDEADQRSGPAWIDDAKNSIRTLLDRIVTRWKPAYLRANRIDMRKLHDSLTPVRLQQIQKDYDGTDDSLNSFDVEKATLKYQETLVPLHYHELWHEIVHDYKDVETTLEKRKTTMKLSEIFDKTTLDEDRETALVFGTNQVLYVDDYKRLSNKPGLFDVILLTVRGKEYFGMIVHVEQNKVKSKSNEETPRADIHQHKDLKYELLTTISVYTSRTCADAIRAYRKETGDDQLQMTKISNMTSSRRMISAIHNVSSWPFHRSLLKPTVDDPYFQLPENYQSEDVDETDEFNLPQSKVIAIAEHMASGLQERMHLVHGPPGTGKSRTIAAIVLKLLEKLPSKKKILLCAPSNNACDELCRRILTEFNRRGEVLTEGTLVRVGCQPPDDYNLCSHFLDFIVLKDMVNVLKNEGLIDQNLPKSTENRMMRHAKIVVSTLNYCGSTRMSSLKRNTDFIIIDEACQSLEGDMLIPLRFNCSKVMLVGDPLQLPPCVLSDAGKSYGLSQSFYTRLYSIFNQCVDGPITMLDTQYRMHPQICSFPSKQFYHEQLCTDQSVTKRAKNFSLRPLYLYNLTRSFHDQESDGSSFNKSEAQFIQKFLKELIEHLVDESEDDVSDSEDEEEDSSVSSSENEREAISPDEQMASRTLRAIEVQKRIAVITPYHGQIRLLRSMLPPYIEIMTVDSAQGKEKDIIIISCVRSGSTIGFLDDTNRMNVMLTRSKYALYIVGNFTQLALQHSCWDDLLQNATRRNIIERVDDYFPDLPML